MTTQQQIEEKLSKLTTLEQLVEWMLSDEGRDPDNQRLWTQLPTFGGDEPKSGTSGIWSWDLDRVLEGYCADELSIETRQSLINESFSETLEPSREICEEKVQTYETSEEFIAGFQALADWD